MRVAGRIIYDKWQSEGAAQNHAHPFQCDIPAGAIRAELEKILADGIFRSSDGLSRFLRFIVEQTLLGNGEALKETVIGVEVFRRGATFDPRLDAIVRVDARRLRAKLAEYYAAAGKHDPVYIEVRKGSYAPAFSGAQPSAEPLAAKNGMDSESRFSSIAVLPFISLSTDPENEYFSDGLTEEVIAALTMIPRLRVIARSTTFRYQGKSHDIPRLGAELHVETVLEGSVRRTGDRLRINAQLIDVATCFHIWSRTFEGNTGDIFAVQREISRSIEGMVRVQVPGGSAEPAAAVKDVSDNHEAYDLYLKGIYCESKRTTSALAEGVEYLRQAARLTPDCAPVLSRLADSWALQTLYGIESPESAMASAQAAARRALEIDATLAEAHAARALVSALYEWDWAAAERGFRRAIELNPKVSEIHHRFAMYFLIPNGRFEEAFKAIRQAKSLDPLSLVLSAAECAALFWARDFEASIACGLKTLELDPGYSLTHTFLVSPYQEKGMLDQALHSAETAVLLSGGTPLALRQLGTTYALMGRVDDAVRIIEQLKARTHVASPMISDIYLALNDKESAFEWLETARQRRSAVLIYAGVTPGADKLRADPRFGALIREIGIAELPARRNAGEAGGVARIA